MSNKICCVHCKNVYSSKGIDTHHLRKHTTAGRKDYGKGTGKFQLFCCCIICKTMCSVQNIDRHHEKHIRIRPTKSCQKCGNEHKKDGKFCSLRCANTRMRPEEVKNKISETLKQRAATRKSFYKTNIYFRKQERYSIRSSTCLERWLSRTNYYFYK